MNDRWVVMRNRQDDKLTYAVVTKAKADKLFFAANFWVPVCEADTEEEGEALAQLMPDTLTGVNT